MMDEPPHIGERVCAVPGGPVMIVEKRALGASFICRWFDGERVRRETWPYALLEHAEPSPPKLFLIQGGQDAT
jgi:uncharacterized protein YodC (DUF2158 family)